MFAVRRLAVAFLAAAFFAPSSAAAAVPDGSLRGLVLTGGCDQAGLTKLIVAPTSPNLFTPVRLMGTDFVQSRKLLHPYSITIAGEGLKARHLGPGEVYTRPGAAPKDLVTCTFEGATKEDGPFTVTVVGSILG